MRISDIDSDIQVSASLGGVDTGRTGERGPSMALGDRYRAVRAQTEALCEPLETEDYVVSSMPDVSPTKWHLAHTTWFFERFVLRAAAPIERPP
jgi:hypothetical protein